jgi:glycosyltransferase involved in cell wall biosynthesis
MKIGFDPVPIGGYFGNSTYTTELIKALAKAFPQDDYLVPTYFGKGGALEKYFGRTESVKILPIIPNPKMLGNPFKKTLASLGRSIERKKGHAAYTLYHCTNPLLFNECCDKTVITIHDLIPLLDKPTWADSRERAWYAGNIRSIVKTSGRIIADSQATKNTIMERFPECAEKVIVIPLAAGPQFVRQEPDRGLLQKYGIAKSGRPFFMSVGVFSERKNVPFMLDAFAGLPETLRNGVDIILTGGRPKNKPYPPILDCIAKHKLEKNVFVVPNVPQSDLIALYNMAHGLVFPSLFEGFGLPVLEAMSCGCPVIAANASSLPEVGGDAAIYIDPRDRESLTCAMEKIITSEVERERLRQRGLARAKEFSWEKTARMTYNIYKSVVYS